MAGFPESEDPHDETKLFSGPDPLYLAEAQNFAESAWSIYQTYRAVGFSDSQAFTLALRLLP